MLTFPSADIVIIGGGPAGSALAVLLSMSGIKVSVFEKRKFPREVLCGEFLSHEVTEFIRSIGLTESFLKCNPNPVRKFTLAGSSRSFTSGLSFTGYGLSRGAFDNLLLNYAADCGASVYEEHEVTDIRSLNTTTVVSGKSPAGEFSVSSRLVVGAYGKQNILDKALGRDHASVNTGYFGVKYHIPAADLTGIHKDEIVIAAADNIYCGINCIEGGSASLCFLAKAGGAFTDRKSALSYLSTVNPVFSSLISRTQLLNGTEPRVYGTGNIYFGRKDLLHNNMIVTGDAAVVIPPLAGDGIGMALENAGILSRLLPKLLDSGMSHNTFEKEYSRTFRKSFRRRLTAAGIIQKIIFSRLLRDSGISLLRTVPGLYRFLENNTRKAKVDE